MTTITIGTYVKPGHTIKSARGETSCKGGAVRVTASRDGSFLAADSEHETARQAELHIADLYAEDAAVMATAICLGCRQDITMPITSPNYAELTRQHHG